MKRAIIIITVVVASILAAPAFAHAEGSAWWSRVKSFVAAHAIGSADEQEIEQEVEPEIDPEAEPEADDDGDTSVSTAVDAGMCRVPQQQPETICEIGMGFLCVSTPEKGVAAEETVIRGTVDRRGSVVTSVNVVVQHEYTKETVAVDTSDPETSGCWDNDPITRPFCLDEEGYFAARVPLGQLGPHTVSVSANRLSGSSEEKAVRLSRVEAPSLTRDVLSFAPDVAAVSEVSDDIVSVTVDLLGDCQFCDFIGASTGAVTVTVDNAIVSPDGSSKHVSCSTNVEQGGQGRFVVGVPVGEGQNELTVTVCNVAVEDNCPTVSGISFSGSGAVQGLTFVQPEPLPAYDAREHPVMEWSFRIGGLANDACVSVQFNREPIESVCADGGRFDVTLAPLPGINVATVTTAAASGSKVYPWTFGWGQIVSPFASDGSVGVDIGIVADRALQIALPAATFTDVLQPVLGNFLASDGFGQFVSGLMSGAPGARQDDEGQVVDGMADYRTAAISDIKSTLPGCVVEEGGFMDGKRIEVVGRPTIGAAKIEDARLEEGRILFTINADDVSARIRLVTDENADGVPDKESLPLKVAFRKAYIDLILTTGKGSDGKEIYLVSSPHTDCDYKSRRSCRDMPAALIPKLFLGSATRLDSFVSCDAEGQQVSDDMEELCEALDSLNAQTGLVSEKVLDAVNGMIYCTGSATLTYMLRGGAFSNPIRVGCFPDDPEDGQGALMGCTSGTVGEIVGPWQVSAGIVMGDGLKISESGVLATAGMRVGRPNLFEEMDETLRHPSVGVMVDPDAAGSAMPISSASSDDLLRFALSANALNHLFFLLSEQSFEGEPTGLLDIDLSSAFFERLGFDFVEQCDAFEVPEGTDQKPSSLCNIRPRVGELLGTSLSTYKYFDQKHPLLMRLRGNRALTPHFKIVALDDLPAVPRGEGEWGEDGGGDDDSLEGIDTVVELQLGGVELKFYAFEIDEDAPLDEYGNPSLLLDDEGNPIIRSMRPEDPDPNNGQIISFDLTLLLVLAIGDVVTDPTDPTRNIISIRPLADRTRLVLSPIPGSNATTIPSDSLVPSLANKLSYAIDIFSAADKAIKMPVPKRIALAPDTPSPDSLMSALGLRSIALGADGLSIAMDEASSSITIDIDGIIRQIVQQGGETIESDFPRH